MQRLDLTGDYLTMPIALTEEIKRFIREHAHEGARNLALQAARYPDLPMPFIAQQIQGRSKIEKKLPTWYANENVIFPPSLSLEQCTSEKVAQFKARLVQGRRAVDLTGGFGVDSYFFSQRFTEVAYVERSEELKTIADANFNTLGADAVVSCFWGDGLEWLAAQDRDFDLIYLDPARRDDRGLKVSALEACEPDVVTHWPTLLSRSRQVMIKSSPGLDIERALEQISRVESVYVIATGHECKELLFMASKGSAEETAIHCVDLDANGDGGEFVFTLAEEKACAGKYSDPMRYLYEPNAALMKAGPFKLLSHRTGCPALHPRTRLYTSAELAGDFPGRIFEIHEDAPINRKGAKKVFPEGKANVISRNSGLSAEDLKRKLKLSDGGDIYAIGTRLANESRRVFRCSRLK